MSLPESAALPAARLLLALTTEATPALAEALAEALLERRLAACVALQPLRSLYRWQGELERGEEVQLLIKSHPSRLAELVDTTGAGDLYAAGFLHGWTQGEAPERCGQLGSLCAGQVVTQLGPRPQCDLKELVQRHLG